MSEWINVAPAEELPSGSWRAVDVDDTQIAVFNVNGEYHAIEDMCTHDGGILSGGTVAGAEVTCPRHGARLSVISGEALSQPAYEPVTQSQVRVAAGLGPVREDSQGRLDG